MHKSWHLFKKEPHLYNLWIFVYVWDLRPLYTASAHDSVSLYASIYNFIYLRKET